MISNYFELPVAKCKFLGNIEQINESIRPKINDLLARSSDFGHVLMSDNSQTSHNLSCNLYDWPELKPICDFIFEQAHEYWKLIGYKQPTTLSMTKMWVNRYGPGSSIHHHSHFHTAMIGVLTLEKEPLGGNTVIDNPFEMVLKQQPYALNFGSNDTNWNNIFETEIDCDPGDLLLFPGYLNHMSRPNLSDKHRTILSIHLNSQWN
jgi:Putative 2OG-Fe(II) oxygenase